MVFHPEKKKKNLGFSENSFYTSFNTKTNDINYRASTHLVQIYDNQHDFSSYFFWVFHQIASANNLTKSTVLIMKKTQ